MTETTTNDTGKTLRELTSKTWGKVRIAEGHYLRGGGPMAVWLESDESGYVGTLSVNIPEFSGSLPARCFYLKWWSENYEISLDALASGWVKPRPDLPFAQAGMTKAPPCELLEARLEREQVLAMVKEWRVVLEEEIAK